MRNKQVIQQIKNTISDPISSENFLSNTEINYLISLYNSFSNDYKQSKFTGPIILNFNFVKDKLIDVILAKIANIIGQFTVTSAFFFYTEKPHIIHNDDTFELPDNVYKGITLPLKLYDNFVGVYPKLCFFDQFYFHGPAKFFKGSKDIYSPYNTPIYQYNDIDGITSSLCNDKDNLLTHLSPEWLEGLSLNSIIDWKPGNAIIFDSTRLHCASDFKKLGYKAKLGISIFTKKT